MHLLCCYSTRNGKFLTSSGYIAVLRIRSRYLSPPFLEVNLENGNNVLMIETSQCAPLLVWFLVFERLA